ncbi:MAG: CopG family transcriptional regulator [Betaproteobacteria bacterium]
MSGKIRYTNERLGKLEVIPDFLPPPEALAFREEGVKVTLALTKRSVDFFKREASRRGTQYQRMIRRLLDAYVERFERPARAMASVQSRRPPARKVKPAR